jgi:hypothetical protein
MVGTTYMVDGLSPAPPPLTWSVYTLVGSRKWFKCVCSLSVYLSIYLLYLCIYLSLYPVPPFPDFLFSKTIPGSTPGGSFNAQQNTEPSLHCCKTQNLLCAVAKYRTFYSPSQHCCRIQNTGPSLHCCRIQNLLCTAACAEPSLHCYKI